MAFFPSLTSSGRCPAGLQHQGLPRPACTVPARWVRTPAALEKPERRAGVRTCGRPLGAALTRGQAWRGGGCGMCERHVSPPQTVGKRCSAHLPAAAPRPPERETGAARRPGPARFPADCLGAPGGPSPTAADPSSLRGLHQASHGGWSSLLGADPTQRRAWGAGGAAVAGGGWGGPTPPLVSDRHTFLVPHQAP